MVKMRLEEKNGISEFYSKYVLIGFKKNVREKY